VRYERLVIAADENTFSVEFHPRLTVVAGVARLEREGLVSEIIGALGSSRAGVHAEVVTDHGTRLAVFRPVGARHRVIDIDRANDVTARFTTASGDIDLLAGAGLDLRSARRRLRLGSADLAATSQADRVVERLATIDPVRLWSTADRVRVTDDHLQAEAEAMQANPEDAEVVQAIEARHNAFLSAQRRHELFRRSSFVSGAAAAVAAVPMSMTVGTAAAMPLVIIAAIVTALSFRQYKHLEAATDDEHKALAAAGAQSYLGFHLQRVNGLLASDQQRKRLMQAAEDHRLALDAWRALVGAVDVTWALERRDAIEAVRRRATHTAAAGPVGDDDPALSEVARALVARLDAVCGPSTGGESFPLILDDPLRDLPAAMKPALLELLVRASGRQQLIYLTEDEQVSSWARVEALTGDLSVLEPAPEGAEAADTVAA
jgi:hypothetical protein